MISDSIPNASIPVASSNPKDFAKKKRANRSAKLKQCKLDARREQWLSQVKNKGGCKEEVNGAKDAREGPLVHVENERGNQIEKLEIKQRGGEVIYGNGLAMNHYSDSDFSPSVSPTSHTSSTLGSNESGVNFSASSRSGSSSISNGCYSETMSEEDEDSCLDDWEAVADALAANDAKQQSNSDPPSGKHSDSGIGVKSESGGTGSQQASVMGQAWRPDDAFRPQSLPNLSKQYSFPLNADRHFGPVWARKNIGPIPTLCPICCEELDCTDSSFLPCLCGFRLCLFCHKRILEQDGRCPGCRKEYECEPVEREAILDGGSLTIRLARSCSMITSLPTPWILEILHFYTCIWLACIEAFIDSPYKLLCI